jgi:hypothetical protein
MERLIKKLENIALSNEEILQICNNKANLLTYPELHKYNDINQCLGKYGAVIILYETRKDYGHWVCVFKSAKNKLEFFDPYGLFPDEELKFIPEHFRKISNQQYPHLTYLLYKSNYLIEYNDHKLQKKLKNIATCGRHVGLRILLRKYNIDQYASLFKDKCFNADQIVTMLTAFIN